MAVIKHLPQHDLLEKKLRRLEELAELDVASALPPTDRLPQDRNTVLEDIRRVDTELAAMGLGADYGFGGVDCGRILGGRRTCPRRRVRITASNALLDLQLTGPPDAWPAEAPLPLCGRYHGGREGRHPLFLALLTGSGRSCGRAASIETGRLRNSPQGASAVGHARKRACAVPPRRDVLPGSWRTAGLQGNCAMVPQGGDARRVDCARSPRQHVLHRPGGSAEL